jgi:hypothetical protein
LTALILTGQVRLSGFMLWQSAYSELYFCEAFWPAFRKIDFLRAIRSHQRSLNSRGLQALCHRDGPIAQPAVGRMVVEPSMSQHRGADHG